MEVENENDARSHVEHGLAEFLELAPAERLREEVRDVVEGADLVDRDEAFLDELTDLEVAARVVTHARVGHVVVGKAHRAAIVDADVNLLELLARDLGVQAGQIDSLQARKGGGVDLGLLGRHGDGRLGCFFDK